MSRGGHRWLSQGFTLIEVAVAMAILAVLLGATAQALISYYVAVDMQHRRVAATHNCASVLADMRVIRKANPGNFPGAIVQRYPDAANVAGAGSLTGETVRVNYRNVNSNPLEVTVTSTWLDLRGRRVSCAVAAALTDQ